MALDLILPFDRLPDPGESEPSRKLLQNGLVALFDLRQGRELVQGTLASVDTADKPSAYGNTRDFSGTANVRFPHHPKYAQTTGLTIFALIEVDALTGYGALISKWDGTSTVSSAPAHCPYEVRIGAGATDGSGRLYHSTGSAYGYCQWASGSPPQVPAGYRGMIAHTRAGGQAYFNGNVGRRFLASDPRGTQHTNYFDNSGFPSPATDNGADVWIGRRGDGVTQLDGRIVLIGLADRPWTPDFLAPLIAQPGLSFEPRRILVPGWSVSTGATWNATATEAATAAETAAATYTANAALTEDFDAVDDNAATATWVAELAEAAVASETADAAAEWAAALAEDFDAADLYVALLTSVGAVEEAVSAAETLTNEAQYSADLTEAAATADALEAAATLVAAVAEAASAGDASTAAAQWVALLTGAATAADSITSSQAASYDVSITELASALDAIVAALAGTLPEPAGRHILTARARRLVLTARARRLEIGR